MNNRVRDPSINQKVMYTGNNNKSLHLSVETSLKNLRTTYIDLLYVHWWDWETSIEEVMRSLHTLVLARKVLYLVCAHFWSHNILLIVLFRVFRTPQLGSFHRPTSMREITP